MIFIHYICGKAGVDTYCLCPKTNNMLYQVSIYLYLCPKTNNMLYQVSMYIPQFLPRFLASFLVFSSSSLAVAVTPEECGHCTPPHQKTDTSGRKKH